MFGILHIEDGGYNYALSILKSSDGNPDSCHRYTYAYEMPFLQARTFHPLMHVAIRFRASRVKAEKIVPDSLDRL